MQEITEIKKFILDNLEVKTSLSIVGNEVKVRRNLQHFFAKQFSDKNVDYVYKLVLNYAAQSETNYPGSGLDVLKSFAIKDYKPAVSLALHDYKSELESKLANEFKMSPMNLALFMSAVELTTLDTKISIKKSNNLHSYVELTDGCIFPVKRMLTNYSLLEKPSVVCIDGFIESISEIHRLLEYFSTNTLPCIMFVRGMADDVLHTIKVNCDRGTLKVCPILVPYDLENINTLVDIATIVGSDVVSSYSGNLISSIDTSSIKTIDSAIVKPEYVVLRETNNRIRIAQHRSKLIAEIVERPELEELFKKRIRSLTSSFIEISIADDINFLSNSQQVDEAIRLLMAMMKNQTDYATVINHYSKSLIDTISSLQMQICV